MSFPQHKHGYWAYDTVLDLDRFAPGLLGEVLRGTDTRRQVICAVLSLSEWRKMSDECKKDLAHKLRFIKTQALIIGAFGANPDGFIACLAKMRAAYEPRRFYLELFRLYTNPAAVEAVRYLNACRGFDEEAPSAVPAGAVKLASLGDAFLKHDLISRLGFPWCADDVRHVVGFLRRAVPQVTDEELACALSTADRLMPAEYVIERFLGLRPSPAIALSTHPAFELLTTHEQLQHVGEEFNNCLGDPGYKRLLRGGKNIFLVWRGEEPAVLRLTRRSRLWWLQELKAARNREVAPATAMQIAATLEPLGVFCCVCDLDDLV
ncbi:MAG: hypothetical protein JO211_09010 [Acidobacteriaceae bacterium]|nr:hypothetical protein [Acidobacteriaceae bacterium]